MIFIVTAGLALAFSGAVALAAGQEVCIGDPGTAVSTPGADGHCKQGSTPVTLATQGEVDHLHAEVSHLHRKIAALEHTLSKVSYRPEGLNRRPTLEIHGANLQIVNGSGLTASANGLGNLFIGYDEGFRPQSGSHNLILGEGQTFTSYGGLIAGEYNYLEGPFADVFGVGGNTASAKGASVTGGGGANWASGYDSSVSGGYHNYASGDFSSVSGGNSNRASTRYATSP